MNLVIETFLKSREGYKQINFKYAIKLYHRPANQYESASSMTNRVHDKSLRLLVFFLFKEVANLLLIIFRHIKQLTPI